MRFVVFETEDGVWITTPELEDKCLEEMRDALAGEFTRKEVNPSSCLLVKASTTLLVSD